MQDFRNLKVWEKSHQLVLDVYRVSNRFPRDERFGLTNQPRRGAFTVASKIAEGCGRGIDADFRRSLQTSFSSASEVEYLILLARDLSFLPEDEYDRLTVAVIEIKKMLNTLMQRLII